LPLTPGTRIGVCDVAAPFGEDRAIAFVPHFDELRRLRADREVEVP
jgi:hypothetical protein